MRNKNTRISKNREEFIDRTARKPYGKKAVKNYADPKAHYKGFTDILLVLRLDREDRFFEIGCGGGVLLKMALQKAGYAAAVDHSPEMVELSKQTNKRAVERGKAEIVTGDAADLPWETESFTAGAAAHMFFFVERPVEMLKEVYRVLKPGGRFAMVTMGKGPVGRLVFGKRYSLKTYSNQDMDTMFRKAGFSIVDIKMVRTQLLFRHQLCYAEK
jgi:ubiquinone/menaquinone biosynthesis C-methylase UbiE